MTDRDPLTGLINLGVVIGATACAGWVALDTKRFARLWWKHTDPDWRFWAVRIFALANLGGGAWGVVDSMSVLRPSPLDVLKSLGVACIVVSLAVGMVMAFEYGRVWAKRTFDVHRPAEAVWRDYRRTKWTAIGLFFGFPLLVFPAILLQRLLNTEIPGFVLAFLWMGAWLVAVMRYTYWPCPRCGAPFNAGWWFLSRRRCAHCKLAVGMPTES